MSVPAPILYIDNTATFGGAINSLLHLLRRLDRDRYAPVLVSGQPRSLIRDFVPDIPYHEMEPKLPWIHDRGYRKLRSLRPFRVRALRIGLKRLRQVQWMLTVTLPEALRYMRIGRRYGVRLVHLNNNLESQLAGVLASRLLRVPCIAHARSFQQPARALRTYMRAVDHHIAISSAIRDNLLGLGAAEGDVSIVFDGIDIPRFKQGGRRSRAVRDELGIPADAPVFAIFGRIIPWKGIREFVLAAARVTESRPDARALIVGDPSDGDEAYYRDVVRLIEELELRDRVVLTGYRSDVYQLMEMADVVVHASTAPEPFGMVLIEAMAAGTPVVATRAGGPLDIVRDGETGLLVERGDPDAIASAVLDLLADEARAESMAARAVRRAEDVFGADRYADEIDTIYRNLLGRSAVNTPATEAALVP